MFSIGPALGGMAIAGDGQAGGVEAITAFVFICSEAACALIRFCKGGPPSAAPPPGACLCWWLACSTVAASDEALAFFEEDGLALDS